MVPRCGSFIIKKENLSYDNFDAMSKVFVDRILERM